MIICTRTRLISVWFYSLQLS